MTNLAKDAYEARQAHCGCALRIVRPDRDWTIAGNGRDVPWHKVPLSTPWVHWAPGDYDHEAEPG